MVHKVMQQFGVGTYSARLIVLCIFNYEKGLKILRKMMAHGAYIYRLKNRQSNQKQNNNNWNKQEQIHVHSAESQGERTLIKWILAKEKKTADFPSCIINNESNMGLGAHGSCENKINLRWILKISALAQSCNYLPCPCFANYRTCMIWREVCLFWVTFCATFVSNKANSLMLILSCFKAFKIKIFKHSISYVAKLITLLFNK